MIPDGSAERTSQSRTVYRIRDGSGKHITDHVRVDKPGGDKDCFWRQPNGTWGLNGTKLHQIPLYGSEDVSGWPEDDLVVLVEGEKARDALASTGYFRVLGTACGSGTTPGPEALEVLRDRRVVLWPDNDKTGRKHMENIGHALEHIAAGVQFYEWHEAPEDGGDAADHPATTTHRNEKAYDRLLSDLEGSRVFYFHIDGGFENKETDPEAELPIKTVSEVLEEAGEEVPWLIENVLARGELTEFSGKAKLGGKTTWWLRAISAAAQGKEHGGLKTTPARYLYLTEQGNNFAEALRESGVESYPENIRVIQFKDVASVGWEHLIQMAAAEAHRLGFDALIVDTFATFSRLPSNQENEAGPVGDRMRVLRLVAQQYGLAVALIRHAGKDGAGRGSSAFEAEADMCVTLSRPEGRHDPRVRRLYAIGRHGEFEQNMQLLEDGYTGLGSDSNIEFKAAVHFLNSVLPTSPEEGMRKDDILERRVGEDLEVSASTIDRALKWLVGRGDVGEKQLQSRGRPYVYWLAYNPPGGQDGGESSVYFQTPPVRENKETNKQRSAYLSADEQNEKVARMIEEGWAEEAAVATVMAMLGHTGGTL